MQTTTALWTKDAGWTLPISPAGAPQLVLYFGATSQLDDGAPAIHELVARFPNAVVCGCSTAGEILGCRVLDDSIAAALVHFESTRVRAVAQSTKENPDSLVVGRLAGKELNASDLRHVLILSDGLSVNGTALVAGLREVLPANVCIIGVGTTANPLIQSSTPDLKTSARNYILAANDSMRTNKRGVFAGGDIVTGGATVILAMGAGRKAAKSIDEFLTGDGHW